MRALLFCLVFAAALPAPATSDSLRTAYWQQYWQRDFQGMAAVAFSPRADGTDPYVQVMRATALVLSDLPLQALEILQDHMLLLNDDDDVWMMAVYAHQCVSLELERLEDKLMVESQAEEDLKKREPGVRELYVFTNSIARSYYERGDPLGALRQIDRLRGHPDFNAHARVRGRTLEKAAIISWAVGKYDEARADMEQAIVMHRKLSPEPDFYLAQLTNNLGVICNAQGDLAKAIQLYEIAKEYYLAFEGEDSHWVNVSHSNLGRAYRDLGNLPAAEVEFRKRQDILERSEGTPFQLFENAHYMAIVLYEQGKAREADSWLAEMNNLLNQHFPDDGLRKADLNILKSRLALQAEDWDAAIASAQHALSANWFNARQVPQFTRSHLLKAQALEGKGDLQAALEQARVASSAFLESNDGRLEVIAPGKECFEPLTLLASLQSKLEQVDEAQALFDLTFQTLDEVRLNLDDPASRRFVYDQSKKVYFEYLHHLNRYPGDPEKLADKIFQTIEQAKAFNLRLAQGRRQLTQNGSIPDSLALEENRLMQTISRLNEIQKSLEEYIELDELRQELDSLRKELRQRYPDAYAGGDHLQAPNSAYIQDQLPDGTAYVSLLLSEKHHWIGLVSKNSIEVHFGAHDADFQEEIARYARAFRDPQSEFTGVAGLQEFQALGVKIYQSLLGGFDLGSYDHLIFSPSGNLGQLNPGLLITETGASDYASIAYLIRDFAVSTRWTWLETSEPSQAATDIGFFAVAFDGERSIQGAVDEAEALLAQGNGALFANEQCTESAFLEYQGDFGMLHLATHGIVDDQPWGTYLAFAADSLSDGQLNLIEIAGLDLKARHITLSACKSAQSRWQTGEAFGSLAVGFAEAGCPSLTASLWDAPDQSTREIMVTFYDGLRKGLPKSRALRNAQLEYLRSNADPLKSHPHYWAGFMQIGDDTPLVFEATSDSKWMLILLALLLVIGVQQLLRFRRSKAS